jgi:hypothetical protein
VESVPATLCLLPSVAPREYSDLEVSRNFEGRSYFLLDALMRTLALLQCQRALYLALR